MSDAPLFGLLLAGGRSKRMGRDKALLERDGRSQLAHTAELLERHAERVFISTRPDQSDEPERGRYAQIVDRHDNLGPLAGILSAMEEHPGADWLVLACDLPNVHDDTIEYLLRQRSREHPFTAYTSSSDGLPEPLCAIWSGAARGVILRLMEEGVRCPRKIMMRADTQLLTQIDPHSLDNVNTPDDLAGTALGAGQ